jgi:hypothetical protein
MERILELIAIWAALLAQGVPTTKSQPTAAVPLIENEFVRADRTEASKAPPTVIADCVIGEFDGTKFMPTHNDAVIVWVRVPVSGPDSHSGEALNERVRVRYVAPDGIFGCSVQQEWDRTFITLKSEPAKGAFVDDAVKLDPEHNEVLLNNDRVRVVRVHFGPGESGPMVDKRARVIIVLTDSHATVTLPDGHSEVRDGKAGTVYYGKAGRQATNNIGPTPLENIVVELKGK